MIPVAGCLTGKSEKGQSMFEDGLDIPAFLLLTAEQRREAWKRFKPPPSRKRMLAKDRKFREYAQRKAKRRRARSEWR
jgi:hypothetical protein